MIDSPHYLIPHDIFICGNSQAVEVMVGFGFGFIVKYKYFFLSKLDQGLYHPLANDYHPIC